MVQTVFFASKYRYVNSTFWGRKMGLVDVKKWNLCLKCRCHLRESEQDRFSVPIFTFFWKIKKKSGFWVCFGEKTCRLPSISVGFLSFNGQGNKILVALLPLPLFLVLVFFRTEKTEAFTVKVLRKQAEVTEQNETQKKRTFATENWRRLLCNRNLTGQEVTIGEGWRAKGLI